MGGVVEDPENPGRLKAPHLMLVCSDRIEYLLAQAAPVPASMNCLVHATRDDRNGAYFHVWSPDCDHWVWRIHEVICRFGYPGDYAYNQSDAYDQSDDPVRVLLGVFPD